VPATLQPYPPATLVALALESARQRPDSPALLFKGASLSYGALARQLKAFAAALAALGLQKGERLALLLPNCPQSVICQLGGWLAGAVVTPLNPLYTGRELELALNQSGASTAVVMTRYYDKLKQIQAKTGVRRVIATSIKEYLPGVLRLLFTLVKEKKEGDRIRLAAEDNWLQGLLAQFDGAPPPQVTLNPGDAALLLFTGGTTGVPKAAIGDHASLLASGMQIHAWFEKDLVEWQAVIVALMPFFHVYGNAGALSVSLVGRNPLALAPNPRDLDDVLDTIQKTRPAFVPGVPSLFNAISNHPRVLAGKVDLSSIKACISGAAPLLAEIKQRFEALTGGRLVEGYAMTETMMAAIITPLYGVYKPGAVGIPAPDVEIRIVDLELGETTLGPNQPGELLVRAPNLMRGYWENPTETANMLRDGWLYTGDIGYIDEDGYLFLVDRKKDLIKPGGFQVWPREVEEIIATHPAVAEVGVAGVPDIQQVEAVKAWVVLQPGASLSADELRQYCKARLAAYKVPRQVEFVDSLPKSQVGKILRRELVKKG
jgi:long-chain acyl-CoA synthetase